MFVPIFYFDTHYNTSILLVLQIFISNIIQRGSFRGGQYWGKTQKFEIVYNLWKKLYIYGKIFLHLWIVFIAFLEKKILLHLWKVFITFVEKIFITFVDFFCYICGFFFITFVESFYYICEICYICGQILLHLWKLLHLWNLLHL